jgi:hypothetical protein
MIPIGGLGATVSTAGAVELSCEHPTNSTSIKVKPKAACLIAPIAKCHLPY